MEQEILANQIKKKKNVFFLILLAMLLVGWGYKYWKETVDLKTALAHTDKSAVGCNLESGFYDYDIEINLYSNMLLPGEAVVLYTTNGDNPIENGLIFEEKISVTAGDEVKILSLQAVLYYRGEYSPILYKTFFVGKNVYSRYTYPIVSISTANENLFDFEKGIFVTGRVYQDYLDAGGDPNVDKTAVQSNYNQRGEKWIRESYMEVYSSDGTPIAIQNIGLGVSGRSSSGLDFKSLKLVANKKYDNDNRKFNGHFWREYDLVSQYSHNDSFNKMLLKSGGQEQQETQIRWDIVSELAEKAGLFPIAGAKKVIVYLNGEYYGIMTMTEDYSSYNIGKACGLESLYVEKIDGDEVIDCLDVIGITHLFLNDLNLENNRLELEKVVDMEQFLLYYAIQIIINNVDWPHNNYGMWRYSGDYIEGNEYSDGRYRFYLFDVDLAYMPDTHWRKQTHGDEIFDELMDGRSEIFINIMKSDYYRSKFINIICNLCNTAFSEENIENCVQTIVKDYSRELMNWESNHYNNGENWLDEYKRFWELNVELVKNTMLNRKSELFDRIEFYWPDLQKYIIDVNAIENATIYCDSTSLGKENFSGSYYKNCMTKLSAVTNVGYAIDYWLINGKKVYGNEIFITDELITDGHCNVRLVLKEDKTKKLILSEMYAKGKADWIELYNASETGILLSDYYITDDIDNLEKYRCPNEILMTNDVITINGKGNNQLGVYLCNFNLSEGETIYLFDKTKGEIVDQITIPEMTENESFGREGQGEKWYFFAEPTKGRINN